MNRFLPKAKSILQTMISIIEKPNSWHVVGEALKSDNDIKNFERIANSLA